MQIFQVASKGGVARSVAGEYAAVAEHLLEDPAHLLLELPAQRRQVHAQHNAVLVVIDIVLQRPALTVQGQGDDAVIGPGGMADATGIALVLGAQQAFGGSLWR